MANPLCIFGQGEYRTEYIPEPLAPGERKLLRMAVIAIVEILACAAWVATCAVDY